MRLEEYLQELSKVKMLDLAEEQKLWQLCKENHDAEARSKLIEAYQPLVFKNALPFKFLDNIMDVIQEGTVGLIESVEKYDYKRGIAFSLFATHRIRGRILTFLKKEGQIDLACIDGVMADGEMSVKEMIVDTARPVAEQAEVDELKGRLHQALQKLPEKERLVLEGVYLESNEVKDVAEKMNVSAAHIYRLQKTGIRRVRGMLSRFMQHW